MVVTTFTIHYHILTMGLYCQTISLRLLIIKAKIFCVGWQPTGQEKISNFHKSYVDPIGYIVMLIARMFRFLSQS